VWTQTLCSETDVKVYSLEETPKSGRFCFSKSVGVLELHCRRRRTSREPAKVATTAETSKRESNGRLAIVSNIDAFTHTLLVRIRKKKHWNNIGVVVAKLHRMREEETSIFDRQKDLLCAEMCCGETVNF